MIIKPLLLKIFLYFQENISLTYLLKTVQAIRRRDKRQVGLRNTLLPTPRLIYIFKYAYVWYFILS